MSPGGRTVSLFDRRSIGSAAEPIRNTKLTLDTSGMAAFFGGDVAVAAFTSLHLDPHRRWLGWYNSPGTFDVARRYGRISGSRFLQGLFPEVPTDLVTILGLAGLKGARYIGAHNGTILEETGPFSAFLMQYCRQMPEQNIGGRETQRMAVSIAEINLNHEADTARRELKQVFIYPPILAVVPILASIGTAVTSAVFGDWPSFSVIVFGMLVNGVSSLVIGSGKFIIEHPVSQVRIAGDGILVSGNEFVVLKGTTNAVNMVTRGIFILRFKNDHYIGWCSILLVFQVIIQLFIVPQAQLFGQIMFISSLGISWAYNLWLASVDRDKIQKEICISGVLQDPILKRYTLGTRTSAVVFLLLVLQSKDPAKIMDILLPNLTPGWIKFKADILQRIQQKQPMQFDASFWHDPAMGEEKMLLELLYKDAMSAFSGYQHYTSSSP